MRILVTGGSGVIGTYLLPELLRGGHEATCYSRTAPVVEGVGFMQGDILDSDRLREACRGHQAVIHLAAVTRPALVTTERLMQVNVVGTVNVLEAALNAEVKRVVFASSGAATGFSFQSHKIIPRYLPLDEEHPAEPQDEYGLSKLLGELTCKRYSDSFGLPTTCLRINTNWCLDREGAELAVRSSGWVKGRTVEELWNWRYRKCILEPDADWPVPGPPSPQNLLWAVTDVRDCAQAFRLAVEDERLLHEIFAINGDDTCSMLETRELIACHFPQVPLRAPLEGYASLVSHEKATRLLGYRPRYTWRVGEFRDWLEQYFLCGTPLASSG